MDEALPDELANRVLRSLSLESDTLETLERTSQELTDKGVYGLERVDDRVRPFKLLRSQLYKRIVEDNLKLIGITSPSPQVGKSFVASNLAAALSRLSDVEVYLIDLDLLRPAQARNFSIVGGDSLGLLDYLSGEVEDLQGIALRVNEERLVVVPSHTRATRSGELLTSPRGDALFAALRTLPPSAVVIIDMPPIFADDDAVIIAQRLDAYIMIVEDGSTTRKQVRDTMRTMHPTPLLGTVLNKYKQNVLSDEYGYGSSYGYGSYY